MNTSTITKKKIIVTPLIKNTDYSEGEWKVVIFNCYCHSFDEVVTQIVRAICCTNEKATDITSVADRTGSATVCIGSQEYCEKVAVMLGKVGLDVTVI
ncbi:MAG: ATP-dependent Clp protease adaptor ClpS [Candidatus Taylorbacteria bacterium]